LGDKRIGRATIRFRTGRLVVSCANSVSSPASVSASTASLFQLVRQTVQVFIFTFG
jgi:hypothetical protein